MSGEGGTMASGAATLGTHRGSIRGDTVNLVTVRPEDGTAPPTAWEMAPLRVGDAIRGTVAVREPIGTATRIEDGHFEARNDDQCVQRKRENPNHRDTVLTKLMRALCGDFGWCEEKCALGRTDLDPTDFSHKRVSRVTRLWKKKAQSVRAETTLQTLLL